MNHYNRNGGNGE